MSVPTGDPVPDFVRAVGRQIGAAVALFLPALPAATPVVWTDRVVPGDGDIARLEAAARRWLADRSDSAGSVDSVDGWSVLRADVGDEEHDDPGGLLILARAPRGKWSAADQEDARFSARVLGAMTGLGRWEEAEPWLDPGEAGVTYHPGSLASRLRVPERAADQPVAVYAVHVDGLRVVNEVLGRPAGDRFLAETERRLAEWVGDCGGTARIEGVRLLAWREDQSRLDEAAAGAEQLRAGLTRPVHVDGSQVSRSVSIGVAVGRAGTGVPGTLITHALSGARAARAAGGNTVRAYDEHDYADQLSRFRLELDLHSARAEHALRLVYQPEVDLRTREIIAVEALLRWEHPVLGLLRPDAFIDIAEQTHAMDDITDWVVEESIAQLARWRERFPHRRLLMRMNVPASRFLVDDLRGHLLGQLHTHGLGTDSVCVEITERRMPDDLTEVIAGLAALRAAGVHAAIDDFGTGTNTFAHLLDLPVTAVKIDRTFVSDLIGDRRSAAIVASVVELARRLDLDVVAEGVEDEATARELVRLGCVRAQGNLFGLAVPAAELDPRLDRP